MIVGVVLWQLGIFGGGPGAVNTATGFSKIKPMEPSIKYSDGGGLTFTIMNGAGTPITGLNLTASGDCTYGETLIVSPLGQGATTGVSILTANCTKAEGTTFSVPVTFKYAQSVGGQTVIHVDSGTLKGTVEA